MLNPSYADSILARADEASRATYDIVVVGGGPAGATAAHDLARKGHHVALLDRAGRIKPCGGAIPRAPSAISTFLTICWWRESHPPA